MLYIKGVLKSNGLILLIEKCFEPIFEMETRRVTFLYNKKTVDHLQALFSMSCSAAQEAGGHLRKFGWISHTCRVR